MNARDLALETLAQKPGTLPTSDTISRKFLPHKDGEKRGLWAPSSAGMPGDGPDWPRAPSAPAGHVSRAWVRSCGWQTRSSFVSAGMGEFRVERRVRTGTYGRLMEKKSTCRSPQPRGSAGTAGSSCSTGSSTLPNDWRSNFLGVLTTIMLTGKEGLYTF